MTHGPVSNVGGSHHKKGQLMFIPMSFRVGPRYDRKLALKWTTALEVHSSSFGCEACNSLHLVRSRT